MLEDLDKQVSIWSESVVRAVSRRRFIHKSVKGVFATVVGLTLGTFINVKDAFAVTCTCHFANGHQCYGTGTYHQNCPSGCSPCTNNDWCNGVCIYPNGSWISCQGVGICQKGYRTCTDCKCPNCSSLCTVLSDIICYECCTPQQVEAEMRRLAAGTH